MINFADLLYRQTLTVFGSDATLTLVDGEPVEIRAIDRTAGVEIKQTNVAVMTIGPAADVRRKDLDALAIDMADLDGAAFTINGSNWTIHTVFEVPTPFGAGDGLVRLALVGDNA